MKETLRKIFLYLFEITLFLFIFFGAVIVLTQLWGCITTDGKLVLSISKSLNHYATWSASACAFAGFIIGYLNPSKTV